MTLIEALRATKEKGFNYMAIDDPKHDPAVFAYLEEPEYEPKDGQWYPMESDYELICDRLTTILGGESKDWLLKVDTLGVL